VPDDRPLDTLPIAEVVDRVLARHPDAGHARERADVIAEAADLACSRFAARGRLLLIATDPVTTAAASDTADRFAHEYGFADGGVLVGASVVAVRPSPRDAVVTVADLAGTGEPDVVAALDALAVTVAATLGHLHGDHPVDLVARDDADRERVVAMTADIAGVDDATARAAATVAGHDTRVAVLVLAGLSLPEAQVLAANRRTLRDALTNLPRRPPRPPVPPGSAGG
jgi:hypothetical protein